MPQTLQWLLMGALGSIAVFFLIFYCLKRDEPYNLFFALGCLIAILRIVFYARVSALDPASAAYHLTAQINYLSFIWGPFFYALLADSLFPSAGIRVIRRILLAIALVMTAFILFVPMDVFFYGAAFDYIILVFMLYAVYVYTRALIRKLPFSIPIFIGNFVFVSGITHDVLRGSNVIRGSYGEIFQYTFLVYALIMAVVLAHRYTQSDKKRLEAQLKFLQAQIQPHFLYNTLSTISAYCQTNPETASELLDYLSTYLRGKFRDESDRFTCLNDEIDLVKAYLTIEQARFKERIAVSYDIQDGCNTLIPSLLLQPLVENAVKHGLLPLKEGGMISISVKKQPGMVKICIADNGVGMSKDALTQALEGKGSGIGIKNTNERLLRYYRRKLSIRSAPGAGCEVTVTIPQTRGDYSI